MGRGSGAEGMSPEKEMKLEQGKFQKSERGHKATALMGVCGGVGEGEKCGIWGGGV